MFQSPASHLTAASYTHSLLLLAAELLHWSGQGSSAVCLKAAQKELLWVSFPCLSCKFTLSPSWEIKVFQLWSIVVIGQVCHSDKSSSVPVCALHLPLRPPAKILNTHTHTQACIQWPYPSPPCCSLVSEPHRSFHKSGHGHWHPGLSAHTVPVCSATTWTCQHESVITLSAAMTWHCPEELLIPRRSFLYSNQHPCGNLPSVCQRFPHPFLPKISALLSAWSTSTFKNEENNDRIFLMRCVTPVI